MDNLKETEQRFRTRFSGRDYSVYQTELTLREVVDCKIDHLLDRIKDKPYITFVSKMQILYGNHPLFKDLPKEDGIRVGLLGGYNDLKHIPGRRPKNIELQRQMDVFHYCLEWPHSSLFDIVQSRFRSYVKENRENDSLVRFAPLKGYRKPETGEIFDPGWNKSEPWNNSMYSGYLIWDSSNVQKINEFLHDEADVRLRTIVKFAQVVSPVLVSNRIDWFLRSAETTEQMLNWFNKGLQELNAGDIELPEGMDPKNINGDQY